MLEVHHQSPSIWYLVRGVVSEEEGPVFSMAKRTRDRSVSRQLSPSTKVPYIGASYAIHEGVALMTWAIF